MQQTVLLFILYYDIHLSNNSHMLLFITLCLLIIWKQSPIIILIVVNLFFEFSHFFRELVNLLSILYDKSDGAIFLKVPLNWRVQLRTLILIWVLLNLAIYFIPSLLSLFFKGFILIIVDSDF
jgi:hypothetical protein